MDLEPVNLSAVSIDDSSIPTTSTPKKDRRKSYDVYLYTECAQSFSRKANLNAHMRYKHKKNGGLNITCTECNEKFRRQTDLKSHMNLKHLKTKTFKCDHCDRCFYAYQTLYKHKSQCKNNKNKKNYFFCNKCQKEFSLDYKKRHNQVHNPPNYHCDLCAKKFSFKANLSRHISKKHAQLFFHLP